MKHRVLSILVGTSFALSSAAPAVADTAKTPTTPVDKARAHFQRGRELSDAQQFAPAYEEFAAGYALTPRPLFLFNMAECQRALGNAAKARELYQEYLWAEPSGSLATTAQSRLDELKPPPPSAAPPPTAPAPNQVQPAAFAEPGPTVTGTQNLGAEPAASRPIYKRPIFWVGVGVAVAGGIAITYVATRSSDTCTGPCVDLR